MPATAPLKLTPSERLIINVIRSAATPVHAGSILEQTGTSIHTLIAAIKRLERLALILKVDAGDGPRYAPAPKESELGK